MTHQVKALIATFAVILYFATIFLAPTLIAVAMFMAPFVIIVGYCLYILFDDWFAE